MKLILFKGGVETQEYFSLQLAKTFESMGYDIFFYDLLKEERSYIELTDFCKNGNVVMFTFNFNGIAGESYLYNVGGNFWDEYQIPCYNMVVDHPFYYHQYIENTPKIYYQISIDRFHEAYMKRFFPAVGLGGFLPLGGTHLETGIALIPMKERPMDIVFTGNYTRPDTFDKFIAHLDQESIDFYHSILDELIASPGLRLEDLAEIRLKEELGQISEDELKRCYKNMIFIDLSVRFHFRALAVKELVDNGFKVNVFGAGWEALDCMHPENIINAGGVNSLKCLEVINQSKISLNVMPWFKDGAHDRIFNSMLNGAVSLSDDSIYLREQFCDGKDMKFYDLAHMDKIPYIAEEILKNQDWMADMANNGRIKAQNKHSWECRAKAIDEMIRKY